MLLFVADEPSNENEKDGMLQRIKWVDTFFADVPRIILSISLKRHWQRQTFYRTKTLTVEYLNLFLHLPRILKLALSSEAIYVHSCLHAFRILPVYFMRQFIITDMHGLLPEEMRVAGLRGRSHFFSVIERIVVHRSQALVFVTDAMKEHFSRKYYNHCQTYTIPVLSTGEGLSETVLRDPKTVIYAGGLHPWQCVDDMIAAAARATGCFKYVFLTNDPQQLRRRLQAMGVENAQVGSVPHALVSQYYARASFGFVLREDSIVNRVACPTKLVEYMTAGVIPIVKQRDIGDFYRKEYRFVLVDDFVHGRLPQDAELKTIREKNWEIVDQMTAAAAGAMDQLKAQLCGLAT